MATANLAKKANYASMKRLGDIITSTLEFAGESAGHEPTTGSEDFEGRNGYSPDFFEGWNIPMPLLNEANKEDMRELRRGGTGVELKYQNFSVILSKKRRLPLVVGVNINGAEAKKIKRTNISWKFDGRLNKEDQVGDALYDNNILDRGHMVRREDPNWGESAEQANSDTFHFTNSVPQIDKINQQVWLGLENYILSNAKSDNMLVTVFTGPIFSDDDLVYRDVPIPAAFWKVVAIVKDDGAPSVTAYRISQEKELSDLEFVFGAYKTFQISVQEVMDLTNVDFSNLLEFDGFSAEEAATGHRRKNNLESPADVLI